MKLSIEPDALRFLVDEWVRCEPFLHKVWKREPCSFDLDFVWAKVIGQRAQLWPGERSCVITKIETTDDGLGCNLWLAGGSDLSELRDIEEAIANWAKGLGCTFLFIVGRRGWLRALKHYTDNGTALVRHI